MSETVGEKSIEDQIAELEALAAAAEERAKKAEPSAAVKKLADAQRKLQDAREQEAAHKRTARAAMMGAKEAGIRKAATDGALFKGVDLYDLFPLGSEPAFMPSCGFVVLRNPDPSVSAKKDAAVQTGGHTAHEIGVEYVSACVVFPTLGPDGVALGEFLRAHAEATDTLTREVRDLGGAKSRARPLGRG